MRGLPLVTVISAALFLIACSGSETIQSDMGLSHAPDWVNEGTQAVSDNDGQFIQGIGMAPEMGDTSLQTSTADNRARAGVANTLSTYIESTVNDYSASSGGKVDANVTREIYSATKLALSGVKIKAHWKDPKTGNIYSFAEMDMDALDKTIATANNLSSQFKQYYTKNGSADFERFTQEDNQ